MASLPALPRKYHATSIWLLYAAGLMPAAYGFWLGATGRLPGNPVKEFERAGSENLHSGDKWSFCLTSA